MEYEPDPKGPVRPKMDHRVVGTVQWPGRTPGAAPSQKPTKTQGGTSEDSSTHSSSPHCPGTIWRGGRRKKPCSTTQVSPILPQPTVSGEACIHGHSVVTVLSGRVPEQGWDSLGQWWPRRLSGVPVGTFQPDAVTPGAPHASPFTPSSDQCPACTVAAGCHIGTHLA